MILFSAIGAAAGLVLFHAALTMTLRANRTSRIPYARNPPIVPIRSMALRIVGVALLVFGTVMLGTASLLWVLAVVIAGPIVTLVIIMIHNRRVAKTEVAA